MAPLDCTLEDPIGASFRYRQDTPGPLWPLWVPFSPSLLVPRNPEEEQPRAFTRIFEVDLSEPGPPSCRGWDPNRRRVASEREASDSNEADVVCQSQWVAGKDGTAKRLGAAAVATGAGGRPASPIQKTPLKSTLRTHGNLRRSAWPLTHTRNN